jgi:tRNA-Thr(GGU) m(6)t(6)A37 methyltransferase TsaA
MVRRNEAPAHVVKGVTQLRLRQVGIIHSTLKEVATAPKQGNEGALDARLEVRPPFRDALDGVAVGDTLVIVTWLHQARRDVLKVHPRDNPRAPVRGVFGTRSADRPNPLGLHVVTVKRIDGHLLQIGPIEAIDQTPVVDIKPALRPIVD